MYIFRDLFTYISIVSFRILFGYVLWLSPLTMQLILIYMTWTTVERGPKGCRFEIYPFLALFSFVLSRSRLCREGCIVSARVAFLYFYALFFSLSIYSFEGFNDPWRDRGMRVEIINSYASTLRARITGSFRFRESQFLVVPTEFKEHFTIRFGRPTLSYLSVSNFT